jgi:hypothetical protein
MVGKNNHISLITQNIYLKRVYPESDVKRYREESISWTHTIKASPLGSLYKVKLHYSKSAGVKFHVLEPKPLQLADGSSELPHVYSTSDQRLCLFYPDGKEWTPADLFTETIIPWAHEWLFHYETWVGSGHWKGGGKAHK